MDKDSASDRELERVAALINELETLNREGQPMNDESYEETLDLYKQFITLLIEKNNHKSE